MNTNKTAIHHPPRHIDTTKKCLKEKQQGHQGDEEHGLIPLQAIAPPLLPPASLQPRLVENG